MQVLGVIFWFLIICAGICFVSLIVSDMTTKQDEEKNKQKMEQENRKKQYDDWTHGAFEAAQGLVDCIGEANLSGACESYKALYDLGEQGRQYESLLGSQEYSEYYNDLMSETILTIRKDMGDVVKACLKKKGECSFEYGLPSIRVALTILERIGRENDEESASLTDAINEISSGIEAVKVTPRILLLKEYGIGEFISPDPHKVSKDEASRLEASLMMKTHTAKEIEEDYCASAKVLNESFIMDSTRLMWYYAFQAPFDVKRFERARKLCNAFTKTTIENEDHDVFIFGDVEELLARLYVSNRLGGAPLVMDQDESYVMDWVECRLCRKEYDQCYNLASGLAWLELYDLEKTVLNTLVTRKVQLPAELQERLSFLQSGRTKSIRLFEVDDSSAFAFDSSSIDWKADEFAVFFRKIAMKKMPMNYSLALERWAKAIPLQSGQKVSLAGIFEELQRMAGDFDGEVTCDKTDAYAVDLENVRYEDAVLFRFTSERSRCVTVLFSCEKYGRNLNVTTITLFTPEPGMEPDVLEKYAMAAKNNMYMDSFRESILQALDDVLKVEKSIYDDDEASSAFVQRRSIIE